MDILILIFCYIFFISVMRKLDRLDCRLNRIENVLEQNSSYPNKEELKKLKVGGTD